MRVSHIRDCNSIVTISDPWKRLNEGIDFRAALADKNTAGYICKAGGETAGFILFIAKPVFARGGYLRAIGVAPVYKGQGIGRKLLDFAEKRASEQASHFFLCVSSFNRSAQAFYKKCGYSRIGKLPDFIIPGVSEFIYWKRLRRTRR